MYWRMCVYFLRHIWNQILSWKTSCQGHNLLISWKPMGFMFQAKILVLFYPILNLKYVVWAIWFFSEHRLMVTFLGFWEPGRKGPQHLNIWKLGGRNVGGESKIDQRLMCLSFCCTLCHLSHNFTKEGSVFFLSNYHWHTSGNLIHGNLPVVL